MYATHRNLSPGEDGWHVSVDYCVDENGEHWYRDFQRRFQPVRRSKSEMDMPLHRQIYGTHMRP